MMHRSLALAVTIALMFLAIAPIKTFAQGGLTVGPTNVPVIFKGGETPCNAQFGPYGCTYYNLIVNVKGKQYWAQMYDDHHLYIWYNLCGTFYSNEYYMKLVVNSAGQLLMSATKIKATIGRGATCSAAPRKALITQGFGISRPTSRAATMANSRVFLRSQPSVFIGSPHPLLDKAGCDASAGILGAYAAVVGELAVADLGAAIGAAILVEFGPVGVSLGALIGAGLAAQLGYTTAAAIAGGALGTIIADELCVSLFPEETPAAVKSGGPSADDSGYFPRKGNGINYGSGYPYVFVSPIIYSATSSGHPCGAGTSDPNCDQTL